MPRKKNHKELVPRCGRPTQKGKGPPCKNTAGKGTSHLGKGACHKHKGNRGPLKTYKHSMTDPPAFLQELIDKYKNDPRLMDLGYQQQKMFALMDILETRVKSRSKLTHKAMKELRANIELSSKNILRNNKIELNNQYKVHIENLDVLGDISAEVIKEIIEEFVAKKNQQAAREKALNKLEMRISEKVNAIRSSE